MDSATHKNGRRFWRRPVSFCSRIRAAHDAAEPVRTGHALPAIGAVAHQLIGEGLRAEEEVDAFHKAGLEAGGADNGAPGYRTEYGPGYYAAFIRDPDGNNIEAVWHDPNPPQA